MLEGITRKGVRGRRGKFRTCVLEGVERFVIGGYEEYLTFVGRCLV